MLRLGAPCPHERCAGGGAYAPALRGAFLALENFAHTVAYLRLPRRATLAQLATAGAALCAHGTVGAGGDADAQRDAAVNSGAVPFGERHHHPLRRPPPPAPPPLSLLNDTSPPAADVALRHCFSAAYTLAFLHDAFGVGLDERRIAFTNVVNGMPVDWALGALVAQYAALAPPRPRAPTPAALALLGGACVLGGAAAVVVRRRRRQGQQGQGQRRSSQSSLAPAAQQVQQLPGFKRTISQIGL
jgi:hypothetical protein